MARDFGAPTSRQKRYDEFLRIETELRQSFGAAFVGPHAFQKRVSHKCRIHAMIPVKRFLERKDHRHAIHPAGNLAYPTPAPRPYLGAHIVKHWDAQDLGVTR